MSELIQKAEAFVTDLLATRLDQDFLYHNLRHTQRVVKNTKVLIENTPGITQQQAEDILLAAWFHDTGYTDAPENHEERSCEILSSFLKDHNLSEERIAGICNIIMASKMDADPETLPEMIMRDADCSHLAKESFVDTTEMLRQELKRTGVARYSLEDWRKENIRLLSAGHYYHTDYAKSHWQEGKEKNLTLLLSEERKMAKQSKKEKLKAKYKSESPDRGIQTMYRIALNNHLRLSSIADTKANILLSVNAVIISVALSNLIPKLDNPSNSYLIIPTMVMLLFSVISIIFAIMATRPNVTKGKFTPEDIDQKKVNLLFFGTFYKMPYEEYGEAVRSMIRDKDEIYEALTKDLYYLGKVLARKYSLLRTTYIVFLIGTIISVLSFVVAFWAI